MTSLSYGIDMPYEVQLEHHAATSAAYMTVLEPQRSPGHGAARHHLTPGVYMVSLAYNGPQKASLQHVGGGTTNAVSVPEGAAGTPRTSAPMKISVQGTSEYLQVSAAASTGGSARATISVIPAATFDEMEESAQGVSVLSEINTLKTTKADKSALEATNYIKGSAEDLNALTSDNDFGMWRTAAGCLNTPGAGFYHVLVYGAAGTTHRIQKATRYGSQTVPSEHIRVLDTTAGGVWGPWERVDIRTDTSVGTRVFAGNTMIYGDTGWRNITDLYLAESSDKSLVFGTSGGFFVRRTAEFLHLRLTGILSTTSATTTTNIFPSGWRASTASSRTPVTFAGSTAGGWITSHFRTTSGNAFLIQNMPVGDLLVWNESVHIVIPAASNWPTTLIGTPAS